MTDPTEPPFPGGSSPKFRLTLAPGNLTPSAVPRVTGVPPIATKIFLLAATSCDTRCQWPMVTPASLNGACCASAVPAARVNARHRLASRVFMEASRVERVACCRRSRVDASSMVEHAEGRAGHFVTARGGDIARAKSFKLRYY